jgi:deoxyribodipyrimidine photo-lyase
MTATKTAFLFRRDLRLYDNVGLRAALEQGEVLPIFCLDPRQGPGHRYFSTFGFGFMADSLRDLDDQLRSLGSALELLPMRSDELPAWLKERGIGSLVWNRDYTPFSLQRDGALEAACSAHGIETASFNDSVLYEPGSVRQPSGDGYKVFTPFYKRAITLPVERPQPLPADVRFAAASDASAGWDRLAAIEAVCGSKPRLRGGRKMAELHLNRIESLVDYDALRNLPGVEGTTELSPHLKFGTVSPREVCWRSRDAHGQGHGIERELHWREFFLHLCNQFPQVYGRPFRPEFEAVAWRNDPSDWARWVEGSTGYPIVDAGMRELAQTGSMHNRVRMIVASFLVKDLLIDWREGEAYFAQKLTDYDPAVNNGSWQWAASTGADAAPYFRIFNPWLQQVKFDADAAYIKRWVPELAALPAADIHALLDTPLLRPSGYPAPMVDHRMAAERAKEAFGVAARRE